MNLFLNCLFLGKYEIVGGAEAWDELYSEFIGLRENKSSSYILSLLKDITYLQGKIYIIGKCVEVLAVEHSRELVMELKLTGVKGRFDSSNAAQYSADLRGALSYAKKYTNQVARKEKELDAYYKRHSGDTVQRKDYDIWAVTLGKYMGYRIDYDVISAAEFCHMMNSYERYCEVQNAEEKNLLNNADA